MISQTVIAGAEAQGVASARRQVDLEPRAGIDNGEHRRALTGQGHIWPRRMFRALRPRGSSTASRMSPARIARRT